MRGGRFQPVQVVVSELLLLLAQLGHKNAMGSSLNTVRLGNKPVRAELVEAFSQRERAVLGRVF